MDDASFVVMRLLGDLLSPPRCAACEGAVSRRHVFCVTCAATVERARQTARRDGVVAFAWYGGALATCIRRFKYEDRPDLARPLGELLRGACRAPSLRADVVVPVPLHAYRLVERGYNQAALLAAHAATQLGAPLVTRALARVLHTVPQVELSGEGRRSNVAGAFRVMHRTSIEGRRIVLVDDVSTTGATLDACRDALFAAGARTVTGLVLARASSEVGISLDLDAARALDIGVEKGQASSGCAYVPMRANLRN